MRVGGLIVGDRTKIGLPLDELFLCFLMSPCQHAAHQSPGYHLLIESLPEEGYATVGLFWKILTTKSDGEVRFSLHGAR
jgi:hypothetical protein